MISWFEKTTQGSRVARWCFLAGFLVGTAALFATSRVVASRATLPGFVRLYTHISPETQYYPTINQLLNLSAEARRAGKIIVIIGGSSGFYGSGQSSIDAWNRHLQVRLGPDYFVINLGLRGGIMTAGGAVVAEALSRQYPKVITVVDAAPVSCGDPDGWGVYRYIYWQARLQDELLPWEARDRMLGGIDLLQTSQNPDLEMRLSAKVQAETKASDLWNYIGLHYFFTIWYPMNPTTWYQRRTHFGDDEGGILVPDRFNREKDPERFARELRNCTGYGAKQFVARHGQWIPVEAQWRRLDELISHAFHPDRRSKTLIVLNGMPDAYLRAMTDAERRRLEQTWALTREAWSKQGHPTLRITGLNDDDWGDRVHLSATGGKKVAAQVAPEVVRIAKACGFVPPQ